MIKMKWLIISFVVIAGAAQAAYPPVEAESAALRFNKWYISEMISGKNPLSNFSGLKPYVTIETIKSLKAIYFADPNETDIPDSDLFIKAQDYDNDWSNVNVLASDWDGICIQVYVSFGIKKDHTVIDCMVKEDGAWKVQSVAAQDFH